MKRGLGDIHTSKNVFEGRSKNHVVQSHSGTTWEVHKWKWIYVQARNSQFGRRIGLGRELSRQVCECEDRSWGPRTHRKARCTWECASQHASTPACLHKTDREGRSPQKPVGQLAWHTAWTRDQASTTNPHACAYVHIRKHSCTHEHAYTHIIYTHFQKRETVRT